MSEMYKGYKIHRNEYGYFEAVNTLDDEEPILFDKSIESLKEDIDLLEEE